MGWVGFDLDQTLAEWPNGQGVRAIGAPVPAMVQRVKALLNDGRDVRIFTARVSSPLLYDFHDNQLCLIRTWCMEVFGRELPITCIKDYECDYFYDDRARQVEVNTGRVIGE